MKIVRLLTGAVGALALLTLAAGAAGLFPGFPIPGEASYCTGYSAYPTTVTIPGVTPTPNQCNSPVPAGPISGTTGNELAPADTGLAGGSPPQTVTIPTGMIAGSGFIGGGKNLLGNASLNGVQVNGTATVTFATTSSPTSAALIADRWVGDVNVTSGAGRSAIVTSTPTPPQGFLNVAKVYRTSGSLAQPICAWQAVPNYQVVQAQGLTVTFSSQLAALAGLSADNGNVVNMVIIAGTGVDQGFNGSWTASPAITPAWTGISTLVNTPITLTTAFSRPFVQAVVPVTATELGVGLCFTPTTTTSGGATDGFAFTGAQLEVNPGMTRFEVVPRQLEILQNEQFVYAITDTAGPSPVLGLCTETTSGTDAACWIQYPVAMYKQPTVNLVNCGTACFAMPTTTAQTAVTSTCVLTVNATFTYIQGVQGTYLQCAQSGTTAAVGITLPLMMSTSATNGGVIIAWTGM